MLNDIIVCMIKTFVFQFRESFLMIILITVNTGCGARNGLHSCRERLKYGRFVLPILFQSKVFEQNVCIFFVHTQHQHVRVKTLVWWF